MNSSVLARQHDVEARLRPSSSFSQPQRDVEHELRLVDAVGLRAGIVAAVPGVDDDARDAEAELARERVVAAAIARRRDGRAPTDRRAAPCVLAPARSHGWRRRGRRLVRLRWRRHRWRRCDDGRRRRRRRGGRRAAVGVACARRPARLDVDDETERVVQRERAVPRACRRARGRRASRRSDGRPMRTRLDERPARCVGAVLDERRGRRRVGEVEEHAVRVRRRGRR